MRLESLKNYPLILGVELFFLDNEGVSGHAMYYLKELAKQFFKLHQTPMLILSVVEFLYRYNKIKSGTQRQ